MNEFSLEIIHLQSLLANGLQWNWQIDGWIMVTAVLCAVAATILGNFLVLRQLSMMGDALSHAVLPGLAAGFLLTGTRDGFVMFAGAAVIGVLTAVLTDWINRLGKVDEGASMGVVFSGLFALGILMINQIPHTDLDPACVLYGNIEFVYLNKTNLWFLGLESVQIPRSVLVLSVICIVNSLFTLAFFKELRINCFDPALASTMGMRPKLIHYSLMAMVAITVVACFESVGNILVVAMLIVPASAAYLCTGRLSTMIGLSILFAVSSAVLGHLTAIWGPWGEIGTSTAGMMALVSGVLFCLAVLFSPTGGLIMKWWRKSRLANSILEEDILAFLYRFGETSSQSKQIAIASNPSEIAAASVEQIQDKLLVPVRAVKKMIASLSRRGMVSSSGDQINLTEKGRRQGKDIVRSHRLWEQYLASTANVSGDKVHANAEKLEHFTGPALRTLLDHETDGAMVDPHGRPIPPETPLPENTESQTDSNKNL